MSDDDKSLLTDLAYSNMSGNIFHIPSGQKDDIQEQSDRYVDFPVASLIIGIGLILFFIFAVKANQNTLVLIFVGGLAIVVTHFIAWHNTRKARLTDAIFLESDAERLIDLKGKIRLINANVLPELPGNQKIGLVLGNGQIDPVFHDKAIALQHAKNMAFIEMLEEAKNLNANAVFDLKATYSDAQHIQITGTAAILGNPK